MTLSTPIHQHAEPRNATPSENEYAWLSGIHDRLEAIVKELSDGYPVPSTPDHIESAIRLGTDVMDCVYRQMCAADEGEG